MHARTHMTCSLLNCGPTTTSSCLCKTQKDSRELDRDRTNHLVHPHTPLNKTFVKRLAQWSQLLKCCVFCRSSSQSVNVQILCTSALLDCTQPQVRQCGLQQCASLDPGCSHMWIPCRPPAVPTPAESTSLCALAVLTNEQACKCCLRLPQRSEAMACCEVLLPALQVQAICYRSLRCILLAKYRPCSVCTDRSYTFLLLTQRRG